MKLHTRVEFWDDERNIGNSLIVTLKQGWRFEEDGEHVRGFDGVREAQREVRSSSPCHCPQCSKIDPATYPFSPELESEIREQIDIHGGPSEENDFETFDRLDAIIRLMEDMDDPQMIANEFKKELEDFGVVMGMYKARTKEQIDRITIWSSSGRRTPKYAFKLGDAYYIFETWEPLRSCLPPCAS